MEINEAALPNPQTTPVQSSLLNYVDTFHVSLHTTDHFCRVPVFTLQVRCTSRARQERFGAKTFDIENQLIRVDLYRKGE